MRTEAFFKRRRLNIDISFRCALECPNCQRQRQFTRLGKKVHGYDMTMKDLKAVAAVCCGILSEKLRMTHLGEELTPPGLLVERGVVAGSCITACKSIEC